MSSLNKKILLVFVLVLLSGAGLSALIWTNGNKVIDIATGLTGKSLPRFDSISRLRSALFAQKPILYEYYATTDRHAFTLRHTQMQVDIHKAINAIQAMQGGSPELARIEAGVDRMSWLAKKLDDALSPADKDWNRARELLSEVSRVESSIQPDIEALVAINQQLVEHSGKLALSHTQSMINLVISFSALMFLIVLLGGYYANSYLKASASRKQLALFAENSPHPMMRLGSNGALIYGNQAAKTMADSMRLNHFADLLPTDLGERLRVLRTAEAASLSWEYELHQHVFQCDLHCLREQNLAHLYLVDITERKQAEQRLTHQAYHDPVTELPNRRMFRERLEHLLPQATSRRPAAMLLTKPDRIKLVLESQGYGASDQLLNAMGKRLQQLLREYRPPLQDAEVFRFEGAAFGILLPYVKDSSVLADLGDHLKNGMLLGLAIQNREHHFTLSIGAAMAPEHGQDVETLFKNTEVVVNRVRAEGGNHFRLYTQEMGERREQAILLERALGKALERNELSLHFQPQVDLNQKRITGVEVLLRWHSADHGRVSPAHFIPLAEEAGLILPIGNWVLHHACQQAAQWARDGLPPVTLAVNISARQIQHPDFVTTLHQTLSETGLDPARLELELTESVAMQDAEHTIATLNAVRRLGVNIAIDDFGTGFSSLSYLQRFPLDKIKVDQSFVRNVANDATIALSIILLARSLQLRVIAEGVETQEQMEALRSYGCEEMQGYYFGRPMPATEFESLLRQGSLLVA